MNKNDKVQLARVEQKLDDHIQYVNPVLHRIDEYLPKMNVRVDRLEQVEERRKWHIRAIWSALLAGVGSWLVKWG